MHSLIKKKISRSFSRYVIEKNRFSFFFQPLIKFLFIRKRCLKSQQDVIGFLSYKHTKNRFFLNQESYIESKILKDGIHSLHILNEIINNIKPDSIFIDVGANIGSISIPIAKMTLEMGVEVVSCEASKTMCRRFEGNIGLNSVGNIHVNKSAVFSHNNGITFYEQSLVNTNMGLSSAKKNFDIGEFIEKKVDSITIDCLYKELKSSKKISVIKIDVQGAEIDVLHGAYKIVEEHKPVFIFEHEDEYHEDAKSVKIKIKNFFDKNNYNLYVLDSNLPDLLIPIDLSVYVNTNIVALPNL